MENIKVLLLYSSFILTTFFVNTQSFGQTIPTPTQTDEILNDMGVPGSADPGEKIRYKVTVTNTGLAPATNVQLNAVPDTRTTLDGLSFRTSPLAINDAYACTGNVGINVPAVSGLLANDFDDNPAGLTVTAVTNAATTQGGSITIAANGSFTYSPPAGFTGSDTYTYTLNDGNPVAGVSATDIGIVTFTVSNMIWFVDNTGGGIGGTGNLSNPFKTLGDFNASAGPLAGHLVFIRHTGTNYDGGIVLKNTMTLFGSGHTGGANLANVLPFSLAPNSATLPAIMGTGPVITNASGVGIRLAMSNIIRGVNVGNCSSYAVEDNGATGNLTVSDMSIHNTTGGGWRTDSGGSVTVALSNFTALGSGDGLRLNTVFGTFSATSGTIRHVYFSNTNVNFTYDGKVIKPSGASGMLFINDTGTITFTDTIRLSDGSGIHLENADGTYNFNGPTILNGGDAHIDIINGSAGSITFANASITNPITSPPINIDGSMNANTASLTYNGNITQSNNTAGVFVKDHSGGTITFHQSGTLNMTNGTGIQFDNADGTYHFNGTNTLNGGDAGIDIFNGSGGSFTFSSNSSVTNPSGAAFVISGGTGPVDYNGTLSKNNNGRLVDIQNHATGTISFDGNLSSTGSSTGILVNGNTSGQISFNGGTKTITTGSAAGVTLTSNTGTTINFTGGGLVITTTTGIGFNATGGGTVTVQGTLNTISSGTGTALNVVNTAIGANGLNFRSISKNGGTNGIVLNTTGSSGGLTVTGDGGGSNNGSGGTIQNTTGDGVLLTSVANVRLNYMNITNNLGDGIGGSNINGFQLNRCNISGNGNDAATDESGINIVQLTGSAIDGSNPTSITNCTISNNNEFEVQISNTSGTLTDFQMSGNTISSNGLPINGNATSPHGNLVNFLGIGSAIMTTNVTSGSFTGNWNGDLNSPPPTITATAMQCDHSGSGMMTANISGCIFTNNNVGPQASVAGGAQVIFNFSNNTVTGCRSTAINFFADANPPFTKSLVGKVLNNTVGTQGGLNSGSMLGNGISIQNEGAVPLTMLVSGNTIQEVQSAPGISTNVGLGGQATGGHLTSLTITNNTIRRINGSRAITIQDNQNAPDTPAPTICVNISGNNMSDISGLQGDGSYIRLRRLHGVFNVTQASMAALEAANTCTGNCPGKFVYSGAFNFGVSPCALPSN